MQVRTGVQTFGATGFRQATLVNRALGGNHRTPYYRNTYRPPMLASTKPGHRMAGIEDIPSAIGLGTFGVGAILLSQIFPPPVKTIAQVVGVGLIAYGVLSLFPSEAAAGPVKGEQEAPLVRTAIADPATFSEITGAFDEPKWGADVTTGSGDSYSVVVSLSNPSTDQALPVRLKIIADEQRIAGVVGDMRRSNVIVQDSVIIPAADTITIPYETALLTSGVLAYLAWAQYAITLKLIIERTAGLTGEENVRELAQVRFQAQ